MLYHVSRNGQNYGPYTLEDLQRYVTSGNILLTDLARSETMSEWLPVGQVLGGVQSTAFQQPITPGYMPQTGPSAFPDPPNLHWVLVFVIGLFTCGIFFIVWDIVQAAWMRKIVPQSKALFYYIAETALTFARLGVVFPFIGFHRVDGAYGTYGSMAGAGFGLIGAFMGIAALVLLILARFDMKACIEQHYNTAEPIGLQLGPVMTFFFGSLYFQYHFSRINEMKRMARYGVPPVA
ncbi:MAG TPA: DUF4339 domain-containing protein [Acidobacteriaceae bacterium]|nr:DUF4339 domain-containing protein [Acidobacteriaceae bacterium]